MITAVLAVGGLLGLLGLIGIAVPGAILSLAQRIELTPAVRGIAFVVRIALGVTVIVAAETTRAPMLMRVVGGAFVLSGIGALVLSERFVRRMVEWLVRQGPGAVRVAGLVTLVVGALIVRATF